MSYNRSPLAFDDVRDAFERALAAPKGIKIACPSRASATILRSRFNYYRKMDRKENAGTYGPDHPMHNRSAYDKLILRIPPKGATDESVLYIEPRSVEDLKIEEIA